nr:protein FAM186A [Caretta caretta]
MAVQESSSSSLSSGSSYESETNSEPEPEAAASTLELTISPLTEIPPSVKNILDKIDAAQLSRARKEVFKQLFVILDNVNRVCNCFKGMDPEIEEQFFLSGTWAERKRRALLLDKVAILLKASTAQGKDLKFVLESLKEWGEMLSEGKEQVGDTHTVQWVSDMETKLLISLDYTEGCIMQLFDLCTSLVEHRRKKRGKSIVPKTGMWRAWREKVAQKPQEAQPLSPEQMLEDESVIFSRTSELLTMLQEFVGSTLFNKAEAVVVKYIVTMVANLTKAFTLLTKQCRGLQAKYDTLASQESRKQEVQYGNFQKEVQMLHEKKASLEARVQSIEDKYKMLLVANEAMQKELHKVKKNAAIKIEPSLRDMKFGARASFERKSQEDDDNDLSRKKDAVLSAEKLSWKSQADLGKSPCRKREAKVPDKKQLQRPLVERTEDTSDKQETKLLDKKPALKASIERGEDISDKQNVPVERTQDTVGKWDAVIPVEKQEETSGDLAGRRHEQPLDSEQTEAADKWDVSLLGGTQEVVEDVTGEWHEMLPEEHELKADSEEEIERLPSPTELPYQGISRKGKQRRKKESLYTEETHTEMPQSPISRSKLEPSTALYGFNSAILAYLEQKMEKLWKCPSPGKRQAERMLPKDPEAQRLYMALERKLEECFSKMKIKYSSSLEEQKLPRSLELTEGHDEEAKLSDPDSLFLESKVPVISRGGLPAALWKDPNVSAHFQFPKQWQEEAQEPWQGEAQEQWQGEAQEQWQGEAQEPWQEEAQEQWQGEAQEQWQGEAQEPWQGEAQEQWQGEAQEQWQGEAQEQWQGEAQEQWQGEAQEQWQGEAQEQWQGEAQEQWQGEAQEQWQGEAQEWFKKIQKEQQCQMQSPQPEEQLQQQLQGVKEKVEVEQLEEEQLQQEEHQFEELQPQQEPWQEGQKERQEEKQKQWKKWLEEQAEEQRLWRQQQRAQQEEQQRLRQQQQEEQQRLWRQQEEQQRLRQQQQEEQQRLWRQQRAQQEEQRRLRQQQEQQRLRQQQQEEVQRLWQQQEKEREAQARHWQQQVEEHEEQRQLWQQEQAEHDLQRRQWQQQEAKQQEQERLWQQQWQEQLQQLHEQQELQQKQTQQEQYLTPWPKTVPRSREPGTLEHSTKQIPRRPRRETAKEEVLLYEYFQPSAQQMVPTQSKVSLHSQAQSTEETSWLPTLAQKTKGKSLVPSSLSEKRYWVDVEAQRENLVLLGQATQECRLPPHLHMQAKEVIIEILHIDVERLALLFHKYISFCHLHHVRQTLMSRLEAARAVNDGAEVRNLYTYVERVDAYREKVLQCWVAKQKTAERARQRCLGKMISLFAQLRLSSELHLSSPSPLMIKAVDEMKKEFPSSAHARSKSPGYPSPLASVKKVRDFMHPAGVSEQLCDQIESVWRTDVISHSFPVVPKPPVSLLWSQAGGFPDIPRFLELDVSSVRSKPFRTLQTRVQNLPRWKTYGHK